MIAIRRVVAGVLRRGLGWAVPRSWQLGFQYRMLQLQFGHRELAVLGRLGPNRGVAVDAGANVGYHTYRLSQLYDRVVSFEVNPELAGRLRSLAPANVTVHPVGLSSRDGSATLFTPVAADRPIHGWSSLARRDGMDWATGTVTTSVAVRPLDDYALSDVTFVKIDVEGHEVELLAGARDTIARCRPVVMIEVQDDTVAAVREFFAALGYAERTMAEVAGEQGLDGNPVFVPGPPPAGGILP